MAIDLTNRSKYREPDVDIDRWLADRRKLHERRRQEREDQIRIVPFAGALEKLVRAEAAGLLRPAVKASIIALAENFAARNRLSFDGTITAAIRLVAYAEKLVRDQCDLERKLERAA